MVTFWQRCAAIVAAVAFVGGCGTAADLVDAEPTAEPSPSDPTSPTASPSPTSPSPSPSPTKPTTPVVAKPKVGECRRVQAFLTNLGSDNAGRTTAPCRETHNAQTYYVGLMNEPMRAAARSGNAIQLQREASGICGRKLTDWLGGSGEDVAVSTFEFLVSAPTPDQVNAGVRWFTCDLYGVRVANESKLAALPANTRGLLKANRADDWSRCNRGNFKDGTTNIVVCTRPHTYRAVAGIHLGKGDAKYPGPKRMDRSLESACVGPVQSYLGATGGFNYAWTWPSREDWNIGVHWGLCYIKSGS